LTTVAIVERAVEAGATAPAAAAAEMGVQAAEETPIMEGTAAAVVVVVGAAVAPVEEAVVAEASMAVAAVVGTSCSLLIGPISCRGHRIRLVSILSTGACFGPRCNEALEEGNTICSIIP